MSNSAERTRHDIFVWHCTESHRRLKRIYQDFKNKWRSQAPLHELEDLRERFKMELNTFYFLPCTAGNCEVMYKQENSTRVSQNVNLMIETINRLIFCYYD